MPTDGMRLLLPYPPTANLYWRVWRGRAVKSAAARSYQQGVKLRWLTAGMPRKPLAGPVVVSVAAYRPRRRGDLDNTLKILLDALKGLAFVDDEQVVEIRARRYEDKVAPRVEVRIEAEPA